jgi:replicative DNA helicase
MNDPLVRGLPASREAEGIVLGSIILDNAHCDEAAQSLSPSDFSLEANRRIYTAMRDMRQEGKPIDEFSLAEELDRKGYLEAAGGRGYIDGLSDGVVMRTSIAHHIGIVSEKARMRAVLTATENAEAKVLTKCEFEEVVGGLEQDLYEIRSNWITQKETSFPEMVWTTLGAIETESRSTADVLGLTTTLKKLDDATTGIRPTEVWTLGAFPGRGKTAFAKQIVSGNLKRGVPVKFFEIEMDGDPLIRRILAAETGIPASMLRNPRLLNDGERKRIKEAGNVIAGWPLKLDTTASLSITELLARARLSVIRDKVELVTVDHIGLIDAPGVDNTRRLENVSKMIRAFAKQTKVPVLQLSHLSNPQNKEINRRPTMLDLKYSGDIAGHSHVVLLLHVPENQAGEPSGDDEIIVGKIREGCKGPIAVRFNTDRLEFESRYDGNGGHQ